MKVTEDKIRNVTIIECDGVEHTYEPNCWGQYAVAVFEASILLGMFSLGLLFYVAFA